MLAYFLSGHKLGRKLVRSLVGPPGDSDASRDSAVALSVGGLGGFPGIFREFQDFPGILKHVLENGKILQEFSSIFRKFQVLKGAF